MTRRPDSRTRRGPAAGRSRGGRRPVRRGGTRRRRPLRIPLGSAQQRLRVLMIALAIVVSLCAGRLIQIQALDTQAYAAKNESRLTAKVKLPAVRGEITDRSGTVLATTEEAVAITADPSLTATRADEIVDVLVRHLTDPEPAKYREALTKPNTRFAFVARKVPVASYAKIADELTQLGIYGVFRQSDPIRLYPEQSTAAAVLGFVNSEGEGRAGIEMTANDNLTGTPGEETYESSSGYRIPLGRNVTVPAVDGIDYQLTLDTSLQAATERRLAQGMADTRASSGAAVVMNIKTGEVLAMANTPGFDANRPGEANPDDLFNRANNFAFEPGSTGKVLTMAAAIDSGTVSSESRLIIPPSLRSGGSRVTDHFEHGTINLTARGVLVKSSNLGMMLISRQMEEGVLRKYLADFGIGRRTGIELPGEGTGSLPAEDAFGKRATSDRVAFGQAYSTTTIQMAAAVAGIVNGGVYNSPTLIRSATGPDGRDVPIDRGQPRRVVSEETSKQIVSMMGSVVHTGVGNLEIPGYATAGKTGTAQKFNTKTGRYDSFTTSFVGVAPAQDPTLLTYVVLQDGRGSGTSDAGPVFVDIMKYALPHYGIPPVKREVDYPDIEW
ncbi:peptidoglycan D,D-transpeptidase FtsI family protein [Naumannella cuiyingiana]|uniref:Cell division protein FtsI (Penicillin-binding protein 3) n=1 Tax=Naumannella cuiyingiana TaxID=1347891 RepID=A0A7Z0ILZ3_9ACTN|nr:penicillin-binding protein 2 [Naumannella cuiyingiana]NYI72093.1 cell division protein FtsI (penicillin-binding protein 3) [Naumannella cuiyingiana]